MPTTTEPVIVSPYPPKGWLICPKCGMRFVVRITGPTWECVACGQYWRIYRSGKVYKMVDSETYWSRFK